MIPLFDPDYVYKTLKSRAEYIKEHREQMDKDPEKIERALATEVKKFQQFVEEDLNKH
ncbi:MAG: hypothetical protein J1F38_08760 [Muribaculaceae bacterium]|nr:hypothetical protein [Muribaculaceae bacterium]